MAAPTVADFRAYFPQWASAPADATIQAHLDSAEETTPTAVWGDSQNEGILYKAAYTLSLLPGSRDMRILDADKENIFLAEWKRLAKEVSSGPLAAGDTSGVVSI